MLTTIARLFRASNANPFRPASTPPTAEPAPQLTPKCGGHLVLSLIAGLLLAQPAIADDGLSGERMANAMARMMEAFGFGASGDSSSANPGQAMPGMMNPQTNGWSSAWTGGFGDPVREFGLPQPLQALGSKLGAWQPTALDGVWEGRGGGLLIVRNYRFRLYQPNAGYIDGLIQARGQRIALYNPATKSARPYEFALQGGRLALRDAEGRLILYRRLWLEKDLPGDPFNQQAPAADLMK